jgi:hypothetical protein
VFGAIASAAASAVLVQSNAALIGAGQPIKQFAAIGCTVAVAVVSGYLAGLLVGTVNPSKQEIADADLFEDAVFWSEVEPEEEGAAHAHAAE